MMTPVPSMLAQNRPNERRNLGVSAELSKGGTGITDGFRYGFERIFISGKPALIYATMRHTSSRDSLSLNVGIFDSN